MVSNKAKTIADYMIAEGCEQTSSGNWIFTYDEINRRFGTDLPNDAELINQIADYIYANKSDVVADHDLSQGFDLDFYTDCCPNIDEFLFLPVAAGMWKQHELWDGTYTLDDLLDITELIRVRRENEIRAAEARKVM